MKVGQNLTGIRTNEGGVHSDTDLEYNQNRAVPYGGKMKIQFRSLGRQCTRAAPILCSLLLLAAHVACEGDTPGDSCVTVKGIVSERNSLVPLAGVRARLVDDGIDISVDTDSDGVFLISYLGRTYIRDGVLMFRKSGYLPYDTVLDRVDYGVWDLKIELEVIR